MRVLKIIVFVCFISSLLGIYSIFAQENNLKDYYPLGQGNLWIYEADEGGDSLSQVKIIIEGTETIAGVETSKSIERYTDEDIEEYLVSDKEGVKLYRKNYPSREDGLDNYLPPVMIFPFNIESSSYQQEYSGHDKKITFSGKEDVKVLAGEFSNCIKLFNTYKVNEPDGSFIEVEETVWYAEEVGLVKKEVAILEFVIDDALTTFDKVKWQLLYAQIGDATYGEKPSEDKQPEEE